VVTDIVVWTSRDGGASFSPAQVVSAGAYEGITPEDVLEDAATSSASGDDIEVGSNNVVLGFVAGPGTVQPTATTDTPGASDSAGATLGFGGGDVVEAYWTDAATTDVSTATVHYYWASASADTTESLWRGPFEVAPGSDARLASGPSGLYLLSEEPVGSGSSSSTELDVRRWNPTTHAFGAPVVVKDTTSGDSDDEGGLAVDATTGALNVAWPGQTADGRRQTAPPSCGCGALPTGAGPLAGRPTWRRSPAATRARRGSL
jgi:hypothetical protein